MGNILHWPMKKVHNATFVESHKNCKTNSLDHKLQVAMFLLSCGQDETLAPMENLLRTEADDASSIRFFDVLSDNLIV